MDDKNLEKTELNEEELSQVDGGGKMEAETVGVKLMKGLVDRDAAGLDPKMVN